MYEKKENLSKYELARIVGARGLQIAMNAPLLVEIKEEELEEINYDPLKIAEIELEKGVLPITVKRPTPKKKESALKKIKEKEVSDEEIEKEIEEEEKEISKEGEIMKIVNSEEEETEEETEEEGFE